MCGIFGINFKNEVNLKKTIPADIKLLSNLSRSRGQDTFGVCVSFKEDEKIYKQNIDPKQALKEKILKILSPQPLTRSKKMTLFWSTAKLG